MKVVYNENFPREMEREVEFRDGKAKIGAEVVVEAKRIAPVGKGPYPKSHPGKPGDYKKSLQVKLEGPRVWVTATDYKGHWIEWGTHGPGERRTPIFATIRKAVIAAGLRLDEVERNKAE